jgi:hypothetical protein
MDSSPVNVSAEESLIELSSRSEEKTCGRGSRKPGRLRAQKIRNSTQPSSSQKSVTKGAAAWSGVSGRFVLRKES